ncbi:MAG TPA: glycosyltransferase [Acidimicrobiales bacterium]|nr:glycosyltransferase [Acidimicrobiales bacterium]
MTARPRVAVVHDYLTQRGGAERVVLSMLRAFPGAPLYTSLYEPDATFPEFRDHDVRPLWTNRIGALRRDHRRGLFLYPFAFSGLRVDADVVLCSSSGFAHGVRTTGRKVVYCYTPARWLYDQSATYLAGWPAPVAAAVRVAGPALRHWDKRAARTPEHYLTSSRAVQGRIADSYGIEASIVPPPVTVDANRPQAAVAGVEPGFVLCVSRLLAYKNVDAVVEAFEHLPGARLIVAGTGPARRGLEEKAGTNVSFLGHIGHAELAWLYAHCVGVVSASREDFGLTPLEAAAYGKPSAVLRFGGFLDTVVEDETGIFFDEPIAYQIADAVQRLLERAWDGDLMKRHAESFSESSFARRLRDAVGRPKETATSATASTLEATGELP